MRKVLSTLSLMCLLAVSGFSSPSSMNPLYFVGIESYGPSAGSIFAGYEGAFGTTLMFIGDIRAKLFFAGGYTLPGTEIKLGCGYSLLGDANQPGFFIIPIIGAYFEYYNFQAANTTIITFGPDAALDLRLNISDTFGFGLKLGAKYDIPDSELVFSANFGLSFGSPSGNMVKAETEE